ncbi:hypothetical protein E3J84_06500, partial [Candidatus Aerophobetes bacterium]
SISCLEKTEDKELDEILKHEMLHCYLYEKHRSRGHTKEFKNLLKQMEKEIKNERENLIQRESRTQSIPKALD